MQRTCDICGERAATLFDRVIENNKSVEYAYCEACYTRALKAGKNPHEEAQKRLARRGKECKFCGCDVEEFQKTFYSVARTATSKCAVLPSIAHSKHNIYLRAIYTVLYLSFTYIVRAIWTVHCLKAREGRKKVRNISKAQTSAVSVNFLKQRDFVANTPCKKYKRN